MLDLGKHRCRGLYMQTLPSVVTVAHTEGSQRAKWHSLAAAWLGEAFDALDATIYFIALYPAISELTHSKSDSEIGWYGSLVLATFMLGWACGGICFGTLADQIGRAKTMIFTIILYAVATALCAFSHSWQEMAFYRFFVGLGIGGEIGLGTVLVAEAWKNRGRVWSTCFLESSFGIGVLMCAGVNSLLGGCGWRWLFLAGLIPAFLALYIRLTLKESDSFEALHKEKALLSKKSKKDLSTYEKSLLENPMLSLLKGAKRKQLLLTAASCTCSIIGWWACISWIPPWVNQLTGAASVNERSLATTILSIGNMVGCFSTPLLFKWLGRRDTLKFAFAGAWLTTLAMFLTVHAFGLPLLIWCFVVGYFAIMQFVALQIYIPEAFAARFLGSAAGFSFGAGRILAALVAVFGGQLITTYGGSYAYASATIAFVYLAGFFICMKLPETNGQLATQE